MLNKEKLGFEVKKRRKSLKLTQKNLAEGICNQSEISRIESGEFLPSMDVLYLISHKLKLPIKYFFEILIFEEVDIAKSLKDTTISLSAKKNYSELYSFLNSTLKKEGKDYLFHPETKKYLIWQKYLSEYYLKKISASDCLIELSLLLRKEVIGMDFLLDLNIKNSMANILAENNKFEESLNLYREILLLELDTNEANKFRIKVIYNLGKLLYLQKSFEESLFYTNKGIDLSIKIADMSLIGQFFYQKGSIFEQLDYSFDGISSAYQKAHFFFTLMDLEIYNKILKENKAIYLNSIFKR